MTSADLNGLLLKLVHEGGQPEPRFWELFGPLRQDLDGLYWCFIGQPWFGAPAEFQNDQSVLMDFEDMGTTSIQLWRPGSLSRYADQFGEEHIELWGIEPTRDNPQELAALYQRQADDVPRKHARVWLIYTDSTCWEIYSGKPGLIDRLSDGLRNKPWVALYSSHVDRRKAAFTAAGLSSVWAALQGEIE